MFASQLDISADSDNLSSLLKFKTIGGNLDFYVFNGKSYDEVLQQYFEIVGLPKMIPQWAHGFHVRSPAFADYNTLKLAIDGYETFGLPLEGISFSENSLGENFFDFIIEAT
jgi:alpha-glucosidase